MLEDGFVYEPTDGMNKYIPLLRRYSKFPFDFRLYKIVPRSEFISFRSQWNVA